MGRGSGCGSSTAAAAETPKAADESPAPATMAASTRRMFIGGNWKLHGSKAMITELVEGWKKENVQTESEIFIAPPACYLGHLRDIFPADWKTGGQNCYKEPKGAFTGEITPAMIKDFGGEYVIIGHSERRWVFGEDDALIAEKTAFAIKEGLGVVLCIGEKEEEREAGTTKDICIKQLEAVKAKIGDADWSNVVVAYEPVWAIGTGKTATPEIAQETHGWIREWFTSAISADAAAAIRIIYGGSVKPANCADLGKQPDIDGFLVGGASLKPDFTTVMATKFSS